MNIPRHKLQRQVKTTTYYTLSGKRRTIRLYTAYRNMLGRIRGNQHDGRRRYIWKGLSNDFKDFKHFREWALTNGYRIGMTLDRIDEKQGYGPTKCQWITRVENLKKAKKCHKASCKCFWCRKHREGL